MAKIIAKNVGVDCFHPIHDPLDLKDNQSGRIKFHRKMAEIASLREISFSAEDGDRIGIIGKNGAGKTTLIRLLAGHLSTSSGDLEIRGKVTPQISLGAGINPELTARENARLKCLYYNVGVTKIRRSIEDIMELSLLGDYFDLPVGTYSAGMKAKFVMSLLTIIGGDILVMDEWIGTVDKSSVKDKSLIQERVLSRPKIVILASHSASIINSMTNKCIWLEDGRLKKFGPTKEVFPEYTKG